MLSLPDSWSPCLGLYCQICNLWAQGIGANWTTGRAEKRLAQEKVSNLGCDSVGLGELDLSQLIDGQGFNVDSQIAYNGISILMTILADTGANGYLFIDTQWAIEMAKFFGIPTKQLSKLISMKGYNNQPGTAITHTITCHLLIEGWWLLNQPLLVTPLGQHDLIIGRRWFAKHDVWLDVCNQKLVWPEQQCPMDVITEH